MQLDKANIKQWMQAYRKRTGEDRQEVLDDFVTMLQEIIAEEYQEGYGDGLESAQQYEDT